MDGSSQPSPALLAANRRLRELRRGRNNQGTTGSGDYSPSANPAAALPPHLGWESAGVTAVLRRGESRPQTTDDGQQTIPQSTVRRPSSIVHRPSSFVKLYPDIGLAMLRRELTAPGRLWLLLRLLDREGEGKLRIVVIGEAVTNPDSPHRLCGQRQLRNLLKAGEGLFWTRDRDTLWLRSAAKVAHGLGVTRLTGRPVALPLSALLGGIGDFRAHLYAAFHSGRIKRDGGKAHFPRGKAHFPRRQAMPIARQTLRDLSGVGRASQRAYERRAGVNAQTNYAVGETPAPHAQEKRAAQQGTAVFTLKDTDGQQGQPGQSYLAWQLPNSYDGRHQQRPKGRQRRINRELKDLVMKGMPGNVEEEVDGQRYGRVFFTNGKLAAQAYGRDPRGDRYWPMVGCQQQGGCQLWLRVGE
jgi:hypothetical protein